MLAWSCECLFELRALRAKKERSAFFRVIISPNQINGLLFPGEEKNGWDKHMEASSFLRFLRYAPMMAWQWSEKPQTTTLEKNNKCVFSSSLDLLLSPDVFMQCTTQSHPMIIKGLVMRTLRRDSPRLRTVGQTLDVCSDFPCGKIWIRDCAMPICGKTDRRCLQTASIQNCSQSYLKP